MTTTKQAAKVFWIQAFPQTKAAKVRLLDNRARPSSDFSVRHIETWHGPYGSGDDADAALRILFPAYWERHFSADAGSDDYER